ncbi:transcriptional regulator with XRE-family HTH domain [Paraburkholderia sp. GAS41]|jgi:transcriptional regulator with XRE-family HTH domain|uniref:helix-turn-helix domain-containing protein n=1 Tax=Paraburkholderia sp. GAS41 TaxID=3035134 RepID=UPI003D1C0121
MSTRLKILRLQAGLTLEELAQACDLTRSYVSKVERGVSVPSIASALKLSRALKVPVETLFGDDPVSDPVTIVRKRDGDQRDVDARVPHVVSGMAAGHQMMAFVLNPTEKGIGAHPMSHHSGEELLFVLSGSITLRLARREEILEAGDSAHFNAGIPHKVTCTKGSRAQVLIVILPDGGDEPVSAPTKATAR